MKLEKPSIFNLKSNILFLAEAVIPYTPPEAWAEIYVNGLTQVSYNNLRSGAKARNSNLYPSYDSLWKWRKANIHPPGIISSPNQIVVPMQSVVNMDTKCQFKANSDLSSTVVEYKSNGYEIVKDWKDGKK